ncbi:uncharacterized protein Tco025E_02537 [Trypanosoma conorhini]|uniref:Uncharacterized protein n=1 Tax=Trypanosoma conorhini TaxID=83891 RepID=A0A422Q3A8_9TRYP|nr:uncharacterized protein Tco025E_02537 [Trypanosoma conorhini]RNF24440.1 hypothetical protein Tco025E_02537 [Trypanosoma conorhini]
MLSLYEGSLGPLGEFRGNCLGGTPDRGERCGEEVATLLSSLCPLRVDVLREPEIPIAADAWFALSKSFWAVNEATLPAASGGSGLFFGYMFHASGPSIPSAKSLQLRFIFF